MTTKHIIPEPYLTYSRALRKNETPWKSKLWQRLRANRFYGLPFKRQVQIGQYIVDFSCKSKVLIIELDGSHHNDLQTKVKDLKKLQFLESEGYIVLHFWNNDIDSNIEAVLEVIRKAVEM